MKIGLIAPFSDVEDTESLSMIKEQGLYPSLGLGYIAAVLKKESYTVEYLDVSAEGLDEEELRRRIGAGGFDIVGITCTSFTLHHAKYVARIVKDVKPDTTVVVGGPQLLPYPKETLQFEFFDFGVLGEGEYVMLELVRGLEKDGDVSSIAGVIWKNDKGDVIVNKPPPLITDLDSIPFPGRELMPNDKFYCPIAKSKRFTTIITTRGCPFNCTFCLRPAFMSQFRKRSARNVVDEMEYLVEEFGIEDILLYDDTFSLDQDRAMEICKEIQNRKLNIRWDCRTRVDCVSFELLSEMKKAGCVRIHFGVESGNQRILDEVLNKGYTLEQVKETFKWTKDAGIETLAYFMIGSPGETLTEIKDTFDLISEIDPDFIFFGITNILPKTQMYEYSLRRGIIKEDMWKEYTLGKIERPPITVFESDEYTKEDLQKMITACYRRHYLRPSYIIRRLKRISSLEELHRYSKIALELIGKN